jgi:TRAP-type mannitol/chloroaromatic compound transport system substrate-binding protein
VIAAARPRCLAARELTNTNFKKFLDSLTAYSSSGYQWFQVAEVGYDNFMARHAQT